MKNTQILPPLSKSKVANLTRIYSNNSDGDDSCKHEKIHTTAVFFNEFLRVYPIPGTVHPVQTPEGMEGPPCRGLGYSQFFP